MKKNFFQFWKQSLKNFSEATINLFIFLPYFFSITRLLKTFFLPWKNLVSTRRNRAFYLNEWLENFSFNLISKTIGLIMRSSIILFFFLILIVYILTLPLIFCIFLLIIPLLYLEYSFEKTDQEKETELRKKFINTHLIKQENYISVNQWFDQYYAQFNYGKQWWKLANLFTLPPLARDWAIGYTPMLDQYAEDLTSVSYQNQIKSAYDREKEIAQIERILSKSEEANVIIVGDEGVGKHTIVDSLAKKIYEGQVNNILAYKRILILNLEKILNQSIDQKQRENLFEKLLAEGSQAKNIILLIENFDKYIASGVDRVDLTIPIEKYAKTSKLQVIAITQPFFYQKFVYVNEKINHLFEKVDVYEIKKYEAEQILLDKAINFEKRYHLTIPYETIKNVIDKSDFFITHIPFPEKAITLLDSVCVLAKEQKIILVEPSLVDKILSEITHIPTVLTDQMKNKLINLETLLSSMIIQQQEAIDQLASAMRRSFLLVGKRKKPLACFMLLGPTGVGKTETAKAIAKLFFGSDKYLVRFDMSSYQSKTDIINLIGSIETGNPGLLTTAIREKPFGVLLLDEIEKADKNLINIFLTVIDEGYFTDGFGKQVDCKNLVIIATSNAGTDLLGGTHPELVEGEHAHGVKNTVSSGLIDYLINKKIFSPEFLNRFDGIIVFKPLTLTALNTIAKKYLIQIADDIYKLYRVKFQLSDQLLSQIIKKGYSEKFGARNLQRVIREEIEDKVAKLILENKVKEGETINL